MPEPRTQVTLADLAVDPAQALTLSAAEAVSLLAQAGAVEVVLRARLLGGDGCGIAPRSKPERPKERDRTLTLDEIVERSRLSRGWWHRHWRRELPSATKKGRKIIVRESVFERWLDQRP